MAEAIRWNILSLLPGGFVDNIRMAVVFGNSGNEVLIVTKDDQFMGLGTNASGCLGIGSSQCTLEPIAIEPLCNLNLTSVAVGAGPHVLALTADGRVFAWGHNGYCQLGNGSSSLSVSPSLVCFNVPQLRVAQIACGNHHSVALTDAGEVYAWGQNSCGQVGNGTNVNQPTPRHVSGNLSSKKVKSIVCAPMSTFAILESGELQGWGQNGNGQLGVGNSNNQLLPYRVTGEIQKKFVQQVVCGFAHVLAVTDEGDLYAWGSNSCGQLGCGSRSNQTSPVRTALELGRIVLVACVPACNISAAVTHEDEIFIWGQCRGQSVQEPQKIRLPSVDEVFACFASPPVSWRPISLSGNTTLSMQECVKNAFDDPSLSDVKFIVEGKPIYVNKSILKIRCQHYRSMFEGRWSEVAKDFIEITQFSYTVYRGFLQYLYTDKLDLTPEDAVGLLDLANSYCEDELKKRCTEVIRKGISVENAVMFYAAAVKFGASELEEVSFNFCLNHMTAVAQTEAFMALDERSVKHFILEAAKRGAFKH